MAAFALATLLPTTRARAAGYYITDIGTRGLGRAGAFVAAPDSLLAIHYNPAGLSLLRGGHAEASLTLVGSNLRFQRDCPCVDPSTPNAAALDASLLERYDAPSDSNSVLAIPFVGIGYGFSFLDLTVALAAWGPNSGLHDYGALPSARSPSFPSRADDFPGRYSALKSDLLEANFALGVGMRPLPELLPGLRLGFSLMGFQTGNTQTIHLWANSDLLGPDGPEDPNLDVPILFDFLEPFALNWQLGASYELLPGLTLGSSFRGQRNIKTDGTIAIDLPTKLSEGSTPLVTVSGNEIEVELKTAALWRLGLQYARPEVFKAEVAAVYEGWSAHDRVTIRPRNIQLAILGDASALPEILVERGWRDVWSLRVGGELELFEPLLGLRAGYFYEPSAIPDKTLDPSRTDFDKHGFALGLSTQFLGATLEVSGMYVALAGRTITNSQQKLIGPLADGSQELVTVVGNGTYSGNYFIGSASLSYALDAP